jgi:hypothetical protein
MGFVSELVDLVGRFNFCDIVEEYEQGLFIRKGSIIEQPLKKMKEEDKKKAYEKEEAELKRLGRWRFTVPFCYPQLGSDYHCDFWSGRPLHKSRFAEILQAGVYFHLPIIERVSTRTKQEKPENLGSITVPTIDDPSVDISVSCNIRYQLLDYSRAYRVVDNYEQSIGVHTLSILAKHSRGKKYSEWKDPAFVEQLEKEVLDDLRKVVTDKWGVRIHEISITDNVRCNTIRLTHDGQPITLQTILEHATTEGTRGYNPSS